MKSRYLIILLYCFFISITSYAQRGGRSLGKLSGGGSQFWLGVSSGINKSTPKVSESFSVIENTIDEINNEKEYSNSMLLGNQLGILLSADIKAGFGVSLQPQVANYIFGYSTETEWTSNDGSFSQKYSHENRLQYVQIPFQVKYDFIYSNLVGGFNDKLDIIKPFLFGGIAYSRLRNATKIITESGVNLDVTFERDPQTLDVTPQFIRTNWQALAGGGINVDINSFRITLIYTQQFGLNNISNVEERFTNSQQTQDFNDVNDDFNLNNWTLSLQAVFPLKFIYNPHFTKAK